MHRRPAPGSGAGRQSWRFTDEPSASPSSGRCCRGRGGAAVAAQPAAADPTDTVLPIPLAGFGISPPGLPNAGAGFLIASTDPATPGVTRFRPAGIYCCVVINWRNLSTGAADSVYLGYPSVVARTGSGIVVATVTAPPPAPGYLLLAMLPGAGGWVVP